MRAWSENKSVIQLANVWQRPLISGGDRHGCEPSGALIATGQADFTARLWRAGDGAPVRTLWNASGHTMPVIGVAFFDLLPEALRPMPA